MFAGELPEWPFDWPLAGTERLRRSVSRDFIDVPSALARSAGAKAVPRRCADATRVREGRSDRASKLDAPKENPLVSQSHIFTDVDMRQGEHFALPGLEAGVLSIRKPGRDRPERGRGRVGLCGGRGGGRGGVRRCRRSSARRRGGGSRGAGRCVTRWRSLGTTLLACAAPSSTASKPPTARLRGSAPAPPRLWRRSRSKGRACAPTTRGIRWCS